MKNFTSVLSGIIIAVFFLGSSAIYIVDERQRAILFQRGEVIDVKTERGLFFKIAIISSLNSMLFTSVTSSSYYDHFVHLVILV